MCYTIQNGLLRCAAQIHSPNFNARPNTDISAIIIHNISLPPNQFGRQSPSTRHYVSDFFINQLNPSLHPYFAQIHTLTVSAHLFIERDGTITQFVNFNERAWHAGLSSYLGRNNVNDFSIGIELEGTDVSDFSDIQYTILACVIVAINDVYPNTRRQLAGHSDIAPQRKSDPGVFDWQRLRTLIASYKTQHKLQQLLPELHA